MDNNVAGVGIVFFMGGMGAGGGGGGRAAYSFVACLRSLDCYPRITFETEHCSILIAETPPTFGRSLD